MRLDIAGVKCIPTSTVAKATQDTTGFVTIAKARLRRMGTRIARRRAGLEVRSTSRTGAPMTRSGAPSIMRTMCCTMCIEKVDIAPWATGPLVTSSAKARPLKKYHEYRVGHGGLAPSRSSLLAERKYHVAATTATITTGTSWSQSMPQANADPPWWSANPDEPPPTPSAPTATR
jgi:hypothetical protein